MVGEKKDQMNIFGSKIGNDRHHPSSSKVKPPSQKQHCKFVIVALSITKY